LEHGMRWLETSAQSGNDYAAYRLGKEYYRGKNVERSFTAAAKWFDHAAQDGNQYAQYMLGKLYLMGQGVEYDKSMGAYWLSQAAAQGNAYANSLLQQQNSGRPPNVFLGVTRLLHHMGRIFQEHSLPQSNPGGIQIDRKRLEELMEKREAHGLKGNVYEEHKGPTMSM
ncbi:MAG: sel1 repeat family protein, partial [Oscillospiraceae bacterium]|nr:sel1 repeat family protein [Oscillospiraceae bacterium]